ncbi:MAG: ABC transporter permease [Bacteroidetes bacterium]|jgi:putative ABC transport system permease protein|nr:MAG: ABC transporter permease [Bacteroidota bacterium]UCE68547.1 MAG: ABC transporter permease [Flavobacteriaceae bacterium]
MRFFFDKNTWQEIFGSIGKNRTRTIITVIGVLWGIFIYIALAGASKGLDNGFERNFETVAKNSLWAWSQRTSIPYAGYKIGRSLRLRVGDAQVLRNRIPDIEYIAPINTKGVFGGEGAQVVRNLTSNNYPVYGYVPEIAKMATQKIYDNGRFINEEDTENIRKVCVIGERVQQELFEKDEEPVGQFIRIDGVYFQVVGVHKFTRTTPFGTDGDIYIPFVTFRNLYNTGDNAQFFTIAAYDDADVVQVEKDVKRVLKGIHRVHPDDERAFGSFNLGEIFSRIMGFARGITFLSLIVGLATILAGVIGIGNILLISVKERTKELGIRRALGATPNEVRSQILLESVFLTMLAGIIGIILGAGVLSIINKMTEDNTDFPYTNPTVPIPLVIGALLVMVVLGTLIGLIPAQRAVSIKPIDALREE